MGFLDMDSLPRRLRRKYNDILPHSALVDDLDEFDLKLSSLRSARLAVDKELK